MTPALTLLVGAAWGQTYAFPSTPEDHAEFYPTAYYDQGGTSDWGCGDVTYGGHRGSDFGGGSFAGMDEGRTITAAADGVVVATNDGEFDRCTTADCPGGAGFGNYVQIEHPDGRSTFYAHLKQFSVAVSVGDAVVCGQVLGEMGSSGYSTGPHLHFEPRTSGNVAIDPFQGSCNGASSSWTDQGAYLSLPELTCVDPPSCTPVAALSCGDVVSTSNDATGSTSATFRYGCEDFVYSGPELSFTFRAPRTERVSFSVTGLSADLDLFVQASVACDGTVCLGGSAGSELSDEAVEVDLESGQEVVVVVDGWEGATSGFELVVDCAGGPFVETGHTGASEPVDTAPVAPTGHTGAPSDPGPVDLERGCGCAGVPVAPSVALVLLPLALLRRRR